MIVKIKKRENPFAMIDRAALEDDRLSWRARGVLAYLLSKPDDWEVSVQDVISKGKEGREAVRACFRELSEFGYCVLENIRDKTGKLSGKRYVIYEEPKDWFSVARTERPETRPSGKPTVGKPVDIVIRTGSNKKIQSNKDREAREKFQPPTVEEVSELFTEKIQDSLMAAREAEKFYSYYEANGWKVGRNKMKKWKAAAVGWISRMNEYSPTTKQTTNGQANQPRHLVDEETFRRALARGHARGYK